MKKRQNSKKNFGVAGLSQILFILGILLVSNLPTFSYANDPLLIITPPNRLKSAAIQEKYEFQLEAKGGKGSVTWTENTSSLPTGVTTLNNLGLSISSDGLIHGTPAISGTVEDVQYKSFKVTVTDSTAGTAKTASRVFTLTIYRNEGKRKIAREEGCFLAVEDMNNKKAWLPGDLTNNISVGPTVSTQLFRYNLATEKASFNAFGLGIGGAFRFYNDVDMDSHPITGTKSIHYIRPKCRATTLDNFDSTDHSAHSWLSISPMIFASQTEEENGDTGDVDLQPAIVLGFLQDFINIGVGFNLAGRNRGEVFLLMGIGTGFRF